MIFLNFKSKKYPLKISKIKETHNYKTLKNNNNIKKS
jgi:hypothetical protein